MLLNAARRSAGAAGVDDAGEVVTPDLLFSLAQAFDVRFADGQVSPMVDGNPVGHLARADLLNPNDVMAFAGGQHRGHQVLRQLLV